MHTETRFEGSWRAVLTVLLLVAATAVARGQTGSPAPTADVLVVYSPGVLASYQTEGAIEQAVTTEIAAMNEVLASSGVAARVNLVGLYPVPFSQHLTMGQAVSAANFGQTQLIAYREQTQADIVLLMTSGQQGCYGSPGMPAHDLRRANEGYVSVLNGTCGFGHAIGRSLGLGSFPGSSDAARPYAHGIFRFAEEPGGSSFASLMGRQPCSGCTLGARLSDPGAVVGGFPLGDAQTADARRAVVEAAPLVAAYRGCTHTTGGPGSVDADPDGSDHSYPVTTEDGCATGIPDALPSWLSVVSATPASHTGPATVTLRAAVNLDFVQRTAVVTIGKRKVTIRQAPSQGGNCPTLSFAAPTVAVDGGANAFSFEYKAPFACRVFRRVDGVDIFGQPYTSYYDTGLRGHGDVWAPGRLSIEPSQLAYEQSVLVELSGAPLNVQQGPASCQPRYLGLGGVPAEGGSTTLSFDLPPLCGWSLENLPPWISPSGPSTGAGDGYLELIVQDNTGAPRSATLALVTSAGPVDLFVEQPGAICQPSFPDLTSPAFSAGGGPQQVTLTFAPTQQSCSWGITGLPSWITASPTGGIGTTPITFTAAANPGSLRSGTVEIAGVGLVLGQHALPCAATFTGMPATMPAAGGHAVVHVTTRDECPWSGPYEGWLRPSFDINGTGNASFLVRAEPNPGYDREITFSVGGGSAPIVVTQPGPLGPSDTTGCATFSLSATTLSRELQTIRASVRQLFNCAWNVTTSVDWLVPLPPHPQVFDADFDVGVRANTTPLMRTGQITIGGQTLTVTQAAGVGCSYLLVNGAPLPAAGGTTTFHVSTLDGCSWTVPTSPVDWLSVVDAGSERLGPGHVTVQATAPTTDIGRRVSLRVAGLEIELRQSGDPLCALALNADSVYLPSSGGQFELSFSTPAQCTWSVSASAGLIINGAASGTGPGSVTVDVPAHTKLLAEYSQVYVNGRSLSVNRAPYVPYASTRRYLAEGAVSGFFDTTISLFNPYAAGLDATLTFLRSGHPPVTHAVPLHVGRPVDVRPADILGPGGAEFSTVIDTPAPIAIDRTMSWDASGYGSHTEAAIVSPSLTWYLAEGATGGGFNLFYLLQNPSPDSAQVTVTYLRGGGLPPLEKAYSVPGESRQNIWVDVEMFATGAGEVPLLADAEVSAVIEVQNDVPLIVERAMYLDRGGQLFGAGHNSAGVTAPAESWFLAEGATGAYFDMFVLLANPTDQTALVTVDYLRVSDAPLQKTYAVPPRSRFNIWVDQEEFAGLGTALADAAFSMALTSTNGTPIIVERSMWWPGTSPTWHEAHNSPGATATGTRWAIAAGNHRPSDGRETYILVANTSDVPARIEARFSFGSGASGYETLTVPPKSRANVPVPVRTQAGTDRFGVVVESAANGEGQVAQIVVEVAQYRDVGGVRWQAGGNALATRLP